MPKKRAERRVTVLFEDEKRRFEMHTDGERGKVECVVRELERLQATPHLFITSHVWPVATQRRAATQLQIDLLHRTMQEGAQSVVRRRLSAIASQGEK